MFEIRPTRSISGSITAPPSKSVSHRAIIAACLANGASRLTNVLDADDISITIEALRSLGCTITKQGAALSILGTGGMFTEPAGTLYMANSGTSMRFLTALAALVPGTVRLDGTPRMQQRPIGDLIIALRSLGIDTQSDHANDCPPVAIHGGTLRGSRVTVNSTTSSQFVSGLSLIAPFSDHDLTITFGDSAVSRSYIELTLAVMRDFGVASSLSANTITVNRGQKYAAREYAIEGDFSSASYFWGLAAVTGTSITVRGLRSDSAQGDRGFLQILEKMGCTVSESEDGVTVSGPDSLNGIDADMGTMPDTVPTLAAIALFANSPTTIRNVGHLRHKECDRLQVLATELAKVGGLIEADTDSLIIHPLSSGKPATLNSQDDHRMAMSFAILGSRIPGIRILKPDTSKSYPNFWDDLRSVGMDVTPHNIVLTGFRGTGKTTLGRKLAQALTMQFVDLDKKIEQAAKKPIGTIVTEDGWDTFRKLEKEACAGISESMPTVIATGGGTIIDDDNFDVLRKNSTIILLTARPDTIRKRIAKDSATRPPLLGSDALSEVESVLEKRKATYEKRSDAVFDTSNDEDTDKKIQQLIALV